MFVSDDLISNFKNEAKNLRKELSGKFSHSYCLDTISKRYGFKNWNVLRALTIKDPDRISLLVYDDFDLEWVERQT